MNEKQFRVEIEALMAEKRYEEALELVKKQERQPEWIVVQAKIEALLHRRPTAEAHLLEYIFKNASLYRHEEIAKRLVEIGHSETEVIQGFEELGINFQFHAIVQQKSTIKGRERSIVGDVMQGVGIGCIVFVTLSFLSLYAIAEACQSRF